MQINTIPNKDLPLSTENLPYTSCARIPAGNTVTLYYYHITKGTTFGVEEIKLKIKWSDMGGP